MTAALTTWYLELTDAAQLRPAPVPSLAWQLTSLQPPDWRFNRRMYLEVGAAWQWHDKRDWSDQQWQAHAAQPGLETWRLQLGQQTAGYAELLCGPQDTELLYFGLLPEQLGKRIGGAFLSQVLAQALSYGQRVWVHTCNLDHPAALRNYQARGMSLYRTDTGAA